MYFSRKNGQQQIVMKASTSTTATKTSNNAVAPASVAGTSASVSRATVPGKIICRRLTRSKSTAIQNVNNLQTSASTSTAATKTPNNAVAPANVATGGRISASVSRATVPGKITCRRPTRTMKQAEHFNYSTQCCVVCNNSFVATTGIVLCDICRRRLE